MKGTNCRHPICSMGLEDKWGKAVTAEMPFVPRLPGKFLLCPSTLLHHVQASVCGLKLVVWVSHPHGCCEEGADAALGLSLV